MSGLLCLTWNNHYSAFSKLLSNLYLKDLYCDATIVCHGKYYPVHRLVLSTCSDYFEEIFDQIKCKHPFIIIKDVKPEEMEALLNYMYKGEVNVLQGSLPDLIKAAESLRIKGLAIPDDASDKNPCSSEKKRSFPQSSPNVQCKKKKNEESKKEYTIKGDKRFIHSHENIVRSINNENYDTVMKMDELKQSSVESPCRSEMEFHGSYFDENQVTLDVASLKPNINVKVETEELSNYQERFSPQLEELGKPTEEVEPPVSSVIATHFNSRCSKDDDDDQFQVLSPEPAWRDRSKEVNGENVAQPEIPGISQPPLEFVSISDSSGVGALPPSSLASFVTTSFTDLFGRWDQSQSTGTISSGVSEQQFTCPQCPYKSNKKYNVKSHYMYKHSSVRPICCQVCSYRCIVRSDLKRHMVKHTKKRLHPFGPT